MTLKTYSELIRLPSFEERFHYLQLRGSVGKETFGYDRYLNQAFYSSGQWKALRRKVISRDLGCDLGIPDRQIGQRIIVHHMNPIDSESIIHSEDILLDPEYLICVSHNTHEAIHYGDASLLIRQPIVRSKNDTCPWRK